MQTETKSKYQAPALEKGLDILEYLSQQSVPVSQTEIAVSLNKSSNEIYRMLVCLEDRGYIIRDEVSSKYKLSLKLYHLSHQHSVIDELRTAAIYLMEELSSEVREACHMSIIYHDKVMVVLHSRSPEPIALSIEEGNLFPVALTASGKVLLAYMKPEAASALLQKDNDYIKFSAEQKDDFKETLKQIKAKGYYLKQSEFADGIVDVSVPVGNEKTGVNACLTISRLHTKTAVHKEKDELIIVAMKKYAQKIQKKIGLI
ncbi:IclR family transcriptional regulator [Pedobacter alpinus]|uniref:IclR family transcriptional regulator n=1 Tax=Pedobacter alpinus TaxID=1590643 RepID=A0ABW5TPZ3_9SPHI